jgi:hypothetical protein
MLSGLPGFQAPNRTITPSRSRRSMLETLVRHLAMVRLTVGAAIVFMAVGCSGLIDSGGNGGISPAEANARSVWLSKALPVLTTNCLVCHDGSRANIGFIAGDSDLGKRDTILAYEPLVLNIDAPGSSRLLTKGIHEGPALDATQASDLLEWAQAEREAALDNPEDNPPRLQTPQFLPQICTSGLPDDPPANPNPMCPVNDVPLVDIGVTGGASIKFVVQALGSGLYVTNLKLVPGTDGAFIDHPLFVSYPVDDPTTIDVDESLAEPKADTIDRFFSVKMNLMAGAVVTDQLIAGGTAAFVGFLATDKLSIHFKDAKIFAAGCKDLAAFRANASAAFATTQAGLGQSCLSCHGGQNANATSAVDMTQVNNADDAQLLIACNEIRSRMNFQTFDQSGVFLAPDPANQNHPVRFATAANLTTFKNLIRPWFDAELVAP